MSELGPGRGHKQCSNCKKYVGVRNFKCPHCETPFGSGPEEVDLREFKINKTVIFAPGVGYPQRGGICPVLLNSSSKEDLIEWMETCQNLASQKRQWYSPQAFLYMARFGDRPIRLEDFSKVKRIILDFFKTVQY